jgi:HEPN domain-containing protein
MNLTVDISVRELLTQMLEYNSTHSLLYFLAEIERHPNPEDFANHCNKLLNNGEGIE